MPRLLVRGAHYHVDASGAGSPLLLLHGFTGGAGTWTPHRALLGGRHLLIAPDLLGHGRTDAPEDPDRYRIEEGVEDLLALLDHLDVSRAGVLGYSMGGRLALALAAAAPERVRALIVESAGPGLSDPGERRARLREDQALADSIERDGVPAFVDRWERLPLFASQARLPADERARIRQARLAHSARGLANSLRGMGQGAQPPLQERLRALRMPALLLAGALDTAYTARMREVTGMISGARLVIVPDAGHAVHAEAPETFCRTVLAFLAEIAAEVN